jgi:recombinational DNA repair protein RecR
MSGMKKENYKLMLRSVEQAVKVCDESHGFMDAEQRAICESLKRARELLIRMVGSSPETGLT